MLIAPSLEAVRNEVQRRGIKAVATDIGVSRHTLTAALAGVARPGSVLLVAARWQDHQAAAESVRP